jgi:hypothetical protein
MTFRDLEGKDLNAFDGEVLDGSRDNLGQTNGREYINTDDVPGEYRTPAEIAEERDEERNELGAEGINLNEKSWLDDEPSNWEEDLKAGKYDGATEEKTKGEVLDEKSIPAPSFHSQDRVTRSGLEEAPKLYRNQWEESQNGLSVLESHEPKVEKPREKWGTVNPNKNEAA